MMSSAANRRKTASVGSIAFWYGSGFDAGKAVFPLFKKSPRKITGGIRRSSGRGSFRMGDWGPKTATGSLLRLLR